MSTSLAPAAVGRSGVSKAGNYLTFQLGHEVFGLAILKVQEIIGIMPVTRVPRTPEYVRGVINLRGKIIPVVDLRRRFQLQNRDDTHRSCIIVVQLDGLAGLITMGILVDEVSEVVEIGADKIENTPEFGSQVQTDFIIGMGKVGSKVVMLIDVDKVLTSYEI